MRITVILVTSATFVVPEAPDLRELSRLFYPECRMDELTDLAYAARAGDERAVGRFIASAYPEVWRFCAHQVGSEAAEDLAQDTFVRAIRGLGRFRGDASARTWLLAVARNTCTDHLRARTRRRRHHEPLAGHDADVRGPAGYLEIRDLLSRLEVDRRAAFVLTQVLGVSYQEAAAICRCPVGTIRSRVARARSELIDSLERVDSLNDRSAADPVRVGDR